jgi:hypothetical protein
MPLIIVLLINRWWGCLIACGALVSFKIIDYLVVSESVFNMIIDIGFGLFGVAIGFYIYASYKLYTKKIKIDSLISFGSICRALTFIISQALIFWLFFSADAVFVNYYTNLLIVLAGPFYNFTNMPATVIDYSGFEITLGLLDLVLFVYTVYKYNAKPSRFVFACYLVYSILLLLFIFPLTIYFIIRLIGSSCFVYDLVFLIIYALLLFFSSLNFAASINILNQ